MGHRFPMQKYELLHRQLLHEGTCEPEQFFAPGQPDLKAIEAVHDYRSYTHGECVALGMVAATHIAVQRQWLPQREADRLASLLSTLGFPQKISNQNPENYLNRMLHDKKVINGKIRFILPTQIGNVTCVEDVTKEEIINAISVIME